MAHNLNQLAVKGTAVSAIAGVIFPPLGAALGTYTSAAAHNANEINHRNQGNGVKIQYGNHHGPCIVCNEFWKVQSR